MYSCWCTVHTRIKSPLPRQAYPSTVEVGESVVGDGVSFSVTGAVGAIVSGAAGDDVGGVADGAIVSSSAGAEVVCVAVGSIVSRAVGANVASPVDVGADVVCVAVGAIVSRAVGANVASPVDVGAAENTSGDGDAPEVDMKDVWGAQQKRIDKGSRVSYLSRQANGTMI